MTNSEQQFVSELRGSLRRAYRAMLKPYGATQFVDLLSSGRMLRTRLALRVAGKPSATLLTHCKALEMLHTSTLVHDDIIDGASMRRTHQTMNAGLGVDQALMIGNLISSGGLLIAQKAAGSSSLRRNYLKALDRVNAAQQQELWSRRRLDKSIEDYIKICMGKTSAMLELSLRIGCNTAERGVNVSTLLPIIRDFGIAFQLIDDVEDIQAWLGQAGDDRSKSAAFDIELGNYTAPVILAAGAAGLSEAIVEPKSFSQGHWDTGIRSARTLADVYLARAREGILAARKSGGASGAVADRLDGWISGIGDSLMHHSVDDAVTTG